ncbi:LysE family translocator protein [Pseudomonas sp. M47T1]|uniref:LysE family translocator n=1 Tax=unclassified Pseudomonas TaxID=196821 RepID=UPI0002607D3C|nr:LysE family translocator [Pseudomonas sp. M47T1]EIK97173.1 LysE family translocator protein [Pseudomonas sp. M47T1]
MDAHSLLTYLLVASIAIASPGPATVMALHNSIAYGAKSTLWSSLGNASGLFCLSAAAMLGLGVLIASSELIFNAVKIGGACYLFYLGAKQLFGNSQALAAVAADAGPRQAPPRLKLFKSAFLTAASNPKATMFFTALFPQFIDQGAPLLPQFFTLTLMFMGLSITSLSLYALLASRAKGVLTRPRFSRWVNRTVGATFIFFGSAILTMRRQAA